ncbi:sulfite exporter TauE/SafE family protein [Galactobacter sp.]|uniref:sulfite exporter TauE/SafE family protein n=1 Tax=Galactobacter sp. TaxID=2676125 RepID=UPI0025BF7E32|nr:sulfite exporter TauE/SafE family protein [Galactobacter sp.]
MWAVAITGVAVLVGTVLQRISGAGVGLVVAPVLSLLIGPAHGVLVTNAVTTVSGGTLTIQARKQVDWKRYAVIVSCAMIGLIPGAILVANLSSAWLQIVVGSVVLLGLAITAFLRHAPKAPETPTNIISGIFGGLFNVTAGVAAAAMVANARFTRWAQVSYAATMQPVFATLGLCSVIAKLLAGVGGGEGEWPSPWLAVAAVAAVFVGAWVGGLLAKHVRPSAAKALAMTLAALGAVAAVIRGSIGLI